MRSLAIIPARGGSKRLPHKNILPFMGNPMFTWSVKAAQDSNIFERVIVSTEDAEIEAIALKYGFEVIKRPHELATDASTCAQVCLHLLETFAARGQVFDAICCLYATAPLRNERDIAATMRLLGDDTTNEADFAFAVTGYSHSPYQMLIPDGAGFLTPAWPLLAFKKSQDLPAACIGNGSTYAARVPAFQKYRDFYGPRLRGYVMPHKRSIDIDTAEDYELALSAANSLHQGEKK